MLDILTSCEIPCERISGRDGDAQTEGAEGGGRPREGAHCQGEEKQRSLGPQKPGETTLVVASYPWPTKTRMRKID